jgi:hypothetical protein
VRKTQSVSWSEISIENAVSVVLTGELGYRRAAIAFGVPQTTLERKVKKFRGAPDVRNIKSSLGPIAKVFTDQEQNELVSYLKLMEGLFGLNRKELCGLAYQLAKRNNKLH